MQEKLTEWLKDQMAERNWSLREVARRAGDDRSHAAISNALNPETRVQYITCVRLSKAFNVPLVQILEMAELIEPLHPDNMDMRKIQHIYYQLDERKRADLVWYAQQLLGK